MASVERYTLLFGLELSPFSDDDEIISDIVFATCTAELELMLKPVSGSSRTVMDATGAAQTYMNAAGGVETRLDATGAAETYGASGQVAASPMMVGTGSARTWDATATKEP